MNHIDYFYFPEINDLQKIDLIYQEKLSKNIINHFKSKRIKKSQLLALTDGKGKIFVYNCLKTTPFYCLKLEQTKEQEKPRELELVLSPPIGKSFYDCIQNATEVGFNKIILFKSKLSQWPKGKDFNKEKINHAIIRALEQSSRAWIPKVLIFENIQECISNEYTNLVCDENLINSESNNFFETSLPIRVFIGPEGGWDSKEVSYFKKSSLNSIKLNSYILRTQNAITAACILVKEKLKQNNEPC